jgi:hypothetical protein
MHSSQQDQIALVYPEPADLLKIIQPCTQGPILLRKTEITPLGWFIPTLPAVLITLLLQEYWVNVFHRQAQISLQLLILLVFRQELVFLKLTSGQKDPVTELLRLQQFRTHQL